MNEETEKLLSQSLFQLALDKILNSPYSKYIPVRYVEHERTKQVYRLRRKFDQAALTRKEPRDGIK